jgi:hypothetical protein
LSSAGGAASIHGFASGAIVSRCNKIVILPWQRAKRLVVSARGDNIPLAPQEVVMSKLLLPTLAFGIALPLFATATPAAAQSCEDLWYQRNEIYKAQGYCFRTQRGISAFGNAGCQYDNVEDVPLSATQRRVIADIQRAERTRGCPR